MGFEVKKYEQIRDDELRDIKNQKPEAQTGDGSDYRIRANATAAATEGLYQHQAWAARQIFASDADEDYLERHAAEYRIFKKAANASTGPVIFTGVEGTIYEAGKEFKALDEQVYLTTEAGTIPAEGSITLAAKASEAGLTGNQEAGASVTLTSAPPGSDSTATIVTMTSGTDKESNASLLVRLKARRQNPPAGGNAADYERWALEVPGVTQAFCYPLRRGAKTVDVAVLSNGEPPSDELLAEVQTNVESKAPAGTDFMALKPTQVYVDTTAELELDSTVTLAEVVAQAETMRAAYFAAMVPGGTAYRVKIEAILTNLDGVIDVTMPEPAANTLTTVSASSVEIPALGALTLTEA